MTERDIFLSALDVPSADRSAFLARECGRDDDLRQRVRTLLTAHDRAGQFLEDRRPAADATGTLPPAEFPPAAHPPGADHAGSVVGGRYKLLERIGEGGMGSVWMADQTHPVKRRVAVKLIKEGMDSARVMARFDAERQALALMNHPNIAKVLDAGTTDAGRPFFVMELVPGVPITTFCDTHRLSVADRLAVVQQVCQAVQHAHQKGVIHRDLKPGNILVESHDGRPVPKVIDFGLAKALGGGNPLTEHTLFTGFGTIVGTPLYMAPEQAEFNAVDVDTRADVYALGVLLYELLTGTTPLERRRFARVALDEMLRLIREEDPPKPSTRLSQVRSAERETKEGASDPRPPLTAPRFYELDWIVMKALAKERDRRYESPTAFADDLGRFLRDEPVAAGPPSAAYRVRKFLRRHRGPAAAAAAVLVVLLGGVLGTTWGLVRAETAARDEAAQRAVAVDQRVRAEEQRDRAAKAEALANENAQKARDEAAKAAAAAAEAAAVLQFLDANILKAPRPANLGQNALGADITVRAAIEAAEPKIAEQFRNQPLVEASIRSTLGGTYMWLKRWDKATPHHERAVEIRRRHLGDADQKTLLSVSQLVRCYYREGQHDRAVALADAIVAGGQIDRQDPHAANRPYLHLAQIYLRSGRPDRLIVWLEHVHRERARVNGPAALTTVLLKVYLAAAYSAADRPEDGWPLIRDAVAAFPTQPRKTLADLRLAHETLADVAVRTGRAAEAEPFLRALLAAVAEDRQGEQNFQHARLRTRLGENLLAQGRPADAVPVLEAARQVIRGRRWEAAEADSLLGAALAANGPSARAVRLLTDGYEALKAHAAEDPLDVPRWRLIRAYDRVMDYYKANGRTKKIAEWAVRRYEAYRRTAPPPRPAFPPSPLVGEGKTRPGT